MFINGIERHTGLLPSPAATIARMHRKNQLRFSHECAIQGPPQSEWIESTCGHFWKYRKDQDGQGACVGFSASHAVDISYAKQGFDVNSSPACLYAQSNGGRDGGASVADCLDVLQTVGVFPSGFNGVGDLDWKAVYRSRFWLDPTSALAMEAAKHVAMEAVFCSSLDDFYNGLQSGEWAGSFCLGAGNAFETDANGFLPHYDGTSVNHALCATGGMKKNPKGEWCIEGANSWSGWGLNGLFYATKEWLYVSGQELFLIRAMTIPS